VLCAIVELKETPRQGDGDSEFTFIGYTYRRGGYREKRQVEVQSLDLVFFVGSCRRPKARLGCWRGPLRRSATAQCACRASSAARCCTECLSALKPVTMLIGLKPEPTTNTAQGENPHPFIIIRLSWRDMNRSASRRANGNPLARVCGIRRVRPSTQ